MKYEADLTRNARDMGYVEKQVVFRTPCNSAGMLGCYGVKFRCGWNWLKIEIWGLQALYSNDIYLVFLDPVNPYPKIVQRNRGAGASESGHSSSQLRDSWRGSLVTPSKMTSKLCLGKRELELDRSGIAPVYTRAPE